MIDNIKQLLASKKFKVLLFTILGLICAALSDQMTGAAAVDMGWKAVLVYLGAQGIADIGSKYLAPEKKDPESK